MCTFLIFFFEVEVNFPAFSQPPTGGSNRAPAKSGFVENEASMSTAHTLTVDHNTLFYPLLQGLTLAGRRSPISTTFT